MSGRGVHPAARAHSISLNDASWSSPRARAEGLREYALAQLGTAGLDGIELAKRLAIATVREILPVALRTIGLESEAHQCEEARDLEMARAAARAAAMAGMVVKARAEGPTEAKRADFVATAAAWMAEAAVMVAEARAEGPTEAARAAGWAAMAAAVGSGDTLLLLSASIATRILREMEE